MSESPELVAARKELREARAAIRALQAEHQRAMAEACARKKEAHERVIQTMLRDMGYLANLEALHRA